MSAYGSIDFFFVKQMNYTSFKAGQPEKSPENICIIYFIYCSIM